MVVAAGVAPEDVITVVGAQDHVGKEGNGVADDNLGNVCGTVVLVSDAVLEYVAGLPLSRGAKAGVLGNVAHRLLEPQRAQNAHGGGIGQGGEVFNGAVFCPGQGGGDLGNVHRSLGLAVGDKDAHLDVASLEAAIGVTGPIVVYGEGGLGGGGDNLPILAGASKVTVAVRIQAQLVGIVATAAGEGNRSLGAGLIGVRVGLGSRGRGAPTLVGTEGRGVYYAEVVVGKGPPAKARR